MLYPVYQTDRHHTDLQLIGIGTDFDNAIRLCVDYSAQGGDTFTATDEAQLRMMLQTQNDIGRDCEYMINKVEENKLQ